MNSSRRRFLIASAGMAAVDSLPRRRLPLKQDLWRKHKQESKTTHEHDHYPGRNANLPGGTHSLGDTSKDKLNKDLLEFIKS